MTKQIVKQHEPPTPEIIEKVIMGGDLSQLTPQQRLEYYKQVCDTLGLNPLTKPFDYITLDGKLTLYARKDCTEQLRKRYNISLEIKSREQQESVYVVVAKATLGGRIDESIGAVSTVNKKTNDELVQVQGIAMANAIMKAETKAKRRVTLSICGLGMIDESELDAFNGENYDQRPQSEIIERNVREATANASDSAESAPESQGSYGPVNVTSDNWRERISHVGQPNGNLIGKKVGELNINVVLWMYNKWRNTLGPSASPDDMALKKAIEFAYQNQQEKGGDASRAIADQTSPDATTPTAPATAVNTGHEIVDQFGNTSRESIIKVLRGLCEDLVMTEEQVCGYLFKHKILTIAEKTFDFVTTPQLNYILQNWDTAKSLILLEVKSKVVEKPKRGRRK